MTDQPDDGSESGRGGPPPVPPIFPGQYGGGGGYGGPPGVQGPYQGHPYQPPALPPQPGSYPPPAGYGGTDPGYPPRPGYGGTDPGAYPGVPGYPTYPGAVDPNAKRSYSGYAIAAFVTGLVLPLVGLFAAVPLGIVALVRISKTHARGRWMAITGMVLGVLWWAGVIAIGVVAVNNQADRNDAGVITKTGTLSFGDVRTGDCVNISGLGASTSIAASGLKGVPCSESHNAQAYAIVPIAGSGYPGEASVVQTARDGCRPRFTPYVAPGREPYYLYPTESLWSSTGGHRVVCFVINDNQQPMIGTVVH